MLSKVVFVALAVLLFQAPPPLPEVAPTAGMVIDRSVRLKPGRYRLASASLDAPAITIRGEGLTVDLTGVTLEGGDPLADPDSYAGTGILIDGGSKVTLRGGAVRGYKVGIRGRKSPGLHITRTDVSYNWKQRLWSGIEKESLVDWMSYHNNEKDEWLQYGAAIYLRECDEAEVDHVRGVQGENGLMVTHSAKLKIWNNTFSWNSAVGLGMYRVADSVVAHNKLDWNVRGYSHGFYYRGQDSTAILMYEQTSRNSVAFNSMTHGGDGVFLWAGQSTMDTGKGGANDNLFYGNDVSHAVANGIEATFSRNRFDRNRIDDCWHGVWGGYSFDSEFTGNSFSGNTEAIAIEHGQDIRITGNTFSGDETAIRLWANATQDPNWGYPKNRDTRSRDYLISGNTFSKHKTAMDVSRTSGVKAERNSYADIAMPLKTGIDVRALTFEPPVDPGGIAGQRTEHLPEPGGINAFLPDGARRGRSTIIVDEWGPYDYLSPKLWPTGKLTDRPLKLRVLGPAGTWTLASASGATVNVKSGAVPGEIVVTPTGRGVDVRLAFDYVGGEVVTPRGVTTPAGRPHRFTYELFEPAIDWNVRWWTWDAADDPLTAPAKFTAALAKLPVQTAPAPQLHYISGGVLVPGLPRDRIALRAEGTVTLPPGQFELYAISDDGIRLWVDDKLVIERWSIHGSEVDRAPIAAGRHRLRVEYFEATGWAELKIGFRRVVPK